MASQPPRAAGRLGSSATTASRSASRSSASCSSCSARWVSRRCGGSVPASPPTASRTCSSTRCTSTAACRCRSPALRYLEWLRERTVTTTPAAASPTACCSPSSAAAHRPADGRRTPSSAAFTRRPEVDRGPPAADPGSAGQEPLGPVAVVALDGDERRVDHDAVGHHEDDAAQRVPQREHGAGRQGPPVGELGSAGLPDERARSNRGACRLLMPPAKSGAGLGEAVLPAPDARAVGRHVGSNGRTRSSQPSRLQAPGWQPVGGVARAGVHERPADHVGGEGSPEPELDEEGQVHQRMTPRRTSMARPRQRTGRRSARAASERRKRTVKARSGMGKSAAVSGWNEPRRRSIHHSSRREGGVGHPELRRQLRAGGDGQPGAHPGDRRRAGAATRPVPRRRRGSWSIPRPADAARRGTCGSARRRHRRGSAPADRLAA